MLRLTILVGSALAVFLATACGSPDRLATQPTTIAAQPAAYTYGTASRDGIGKFYCGREISQVMGHLAAGWLNRPEREAEERTDLLLDNLDLKPSDVVADIGAGNGYFSLPIAARLGSGKVLAVDIQPEMLDLLRRAANEAKLANVGPVLGSITDPKLPPGGVDVAFMVDAYHEFDHPAEMLHAIAASLKPGGRVVLVEYRGEDDAVPIKPLHKMTQAQAIREFAAAGLRHVETRDVLPMQHLMIFTRE